MVYAPLYFSESNYLTAATTLFPHWEYKVFRLSYLETDDRLHTEKEAVFSGDAFY